MDNTMIYTRIAKLTAELGPAEAGRRLGIAQNTLARLAAGLPVRAGTLLLAEQRLGLLISSSPLPMAISSLPPAGEISTI